LITVPAGAPLGAADAPPLGDGAIDADSADADAQCRALHRAVTAALIPVRVTGPHPVKHAHHSATSAASDDAR